MAFLHWKIGDRIIERDSDIFSHGYEAKVLQIDQSKDAALIHYPRWKKRWDVWRTRQYAQQYWEPYTVEALARVKAAVQKSRKEEQFGKSRARKRQKTTPTKLPRAKSAVDVKPSGQRPRAKTNVEIEQKKALIPKPTRRRHTTGHRPLQRYSQLCVSPSKKYTKKFEEIDEDIYAVQIPVSLIKMVGQGFTMMQSGRELFGKSIDEIVEEFIKTLNFLNKADDEKAECTSALADSFNFYFDTIITKSEMESYDKVVEQDEDILFPSSYFGLAHLVRFIAHLDVILEMDDRLMENAKFMIAKKLPDFLHYLKINYSDVD